MRRVWPGLGVEKVYRDVVGPFRMFGARDPSFHITCQSRPPLADKI